MNYLTELKRYQTVAIADYLSFYTFSASSIRLKQLCNLLVGIRKIKHWTTNMILYEYNLTTS